MRFITIITLSLWCLCGAVIGRDINSNFQDAVNYKNLQSILVSIDQRLRNFDSIYSMPLSLTIQDKLEQYQRKLEAIDMKIIRIESIMRLNLDKMSENISGGNFKQDISRANLADKIDSIYEGLSHRLGYNQRKCDAHFAKTQVKLEATLTKLEQIWEETNMRDENVEVELIDTRTSCTNSESKIDDLRGDHERSLKNHKSMLENQVSLNLLVRNLVKNSTENFETIHDKIDTTLQDINKSKSIFESFGNELKEELNEYAVKVAEMNVENWNSGKTVLETYKRIENGLNSTKNEVRNGFRSLMKLLGKISKHAGGGEQLLLDSNQMERLNDKLDSNFEKVFSAQNVFMDSCYRLQMDESQIESKISDILEKLMETFEKKTAIEIKDIQELERIIRGHDFQVKRSLHQISSNIITVYEKSKNDGAKVENDLKAIWEHANELFALVQQVSSNQEKSEASNTERICYKIENLTNRTTDLLESLKNIDFEEQWGDLSKSLSGIEEKLSLSLSLANVSRTDLSGLMSVFSSKANVNINPPESPSEVGVAMTPMFGPTNPSENETRASESSTVNDTNDEISFLIDQVFIRPLGQEEHTNSLKSQCKHNYSDLIDVRSNIEDETTNCSDSSDNNTDIIIQEDDVTEEIASKGPDDFDQTQLTIDQGDDVHDEIQDIHAKSKINQTNNQPFININETETD